VLQSTAPPAAWTLITGQGAAGQYAFTFTTPAGAPYPIDGATWEYVVRDQSLAGTPLLTLTTTPGTAGALSVTATGELSQVTLTLNPAATSGLATGTYSHALWMNPGTAGAYLWLTGSLQVNPVPQP
jgi:hypothetical protein